MQHPEEPQSCSPFLTCARAVAFCDRIQTSYVTLEQSDFSGLPVRICATEEHWKDRTGSDKDKKVFQVLARKL